MKTKAFAILVLTLLMATTMFAVPAKPQQNVIKIGIMGPMGFIQGDGMKEAAIMQKEAYGGVIDVGGTPYSVELVFSDEFQGQADGTAETGRLAMEYLMAAGCDFVTGGFRSESVFGAREVAVEYGVPYLTTGAATNEIIDCETGTCGACVRCDYERYKYVFRVQPVRASMLVVSLLGKYNDALYGYMTMVATKLANIYGNPVTFAAVVENLAWTAGMYSILSIPFVTDMYIGPNVTLAAGQAYKLSPTTTDLSTELGIMKAAGVRLIIPYVSAEKIGRAFTTAWKDSDINAIACGVNVMDQIGEAWEETEGKVEYESFLATTGTKTPITAVSVPLYEAYEERWGHKPIYTAWGTLNAMDIFKEAIERADSVDPHDVIPEIEATQRLTGAGNFRFTWPHPLIRNSTIGVEYPRYLDNDNSSTVSIDDVRLDAAGHGYPVQSTVTGGDDDLDDVLGAADHIGTLHDVFTMSFGDTWPDGYGRAMVVQWQNERMECVWPKDRPYSVKWRISYDMYPLFETDLNLDGTVDGTDMGVIEAGWQKDSTSYPVWSPEADMDSNGFVDIADVSRLAKDYGESVTLPYDPDA